MENRKMLAIALLAAAAAAAAGALVFGWTIWREGWWGSTGPYQWAPMAGMMGGWATGGGVYANVYQYGYVGGCPMWGGRQLGVGYVNDTNLVQYVESATGLEVLEAEKYQYNYYVIVGRGGKPLEELLVFPNGVIHPEPQSMMWRGLPMLIDNKTAVEIAERWLAAHFPGSEIEEVHVFPGYYTIHFMTPDGDMQMLSVNGYNGAVLFHWWHGRYIATIKG
ncbi:hypothetical protein TUZN_1038 [Thermoproteus uzoniensis 768-20]|uniref:PepSY domain-containing protein n=1 Tax=Thermoproteus uzoniensis (strain 768-20) TaxID=999630 RepID=F2L6C3_THEU7|nr:hypothetical protein [Thermoproteus uzoniensis]AEA12519.1 hypothetical protein TUZN_1038 [Thermoproteus uzoniensis 768-20]